jgi:hypothetical protein
MDGGGRGPGWASGPRGDRRSADRDRRSRCRRFRTPCGRRRRGPSSSPDTERPPAALDERFDRPSLEEWLSSVPMKLVREVAVGVRPAVSWTKRQAASGPNEPSRPRRLRTRPRGSPEAVARTCRRHRRARRSCRGRSSTMPASMCRPSSGPSSSTAPGAWVPVGNRRGRTVRSAAGVCGATFASLCRALASEAASAAQPDRHGTEGVAGSSPAEGFRNRAAARFSSFWIGSADPFRVLLDEKGSGAAVSARCAVPLRLAAASRR